MHYIDGAKGDDRVTVMVAVNVGNIHERLCETQLVHVLEHCLFRNLDAMDIEFVLDWNGMTYDDLTVYYMTAHKDHAESLMACMHKLLSRPDTQRLKRILPIEKRIVLEEDALGSLEQQKKLHWLLRATQGHTLYTEPLGDLKRSLRELRPERVLQLYDQAYVPENQAMVVVCPPDRKARMAALARRVFAERLPRHRAIASEQRVVRRLLGLPIQQRDAKVQVYVKRAASTAGTDVDIVFPGVPYSDPDHLQWCFVTWLLKSNIKTFLYRHVRHLSGSTYKIQLTPNAYKYMGFTWLNLRSTDASTVDKVLLVLDGLMRSLRRFQTSRITAERFDMFKHKFMTSRQEVYKNPMHHALNCARAIMYAMETGRCPTWQDEQRRIDAWTPESVRACATKLLSKERLAVYLTSSVSNTAMLKKKVEDYFR